MDKSHTDHVRPGEQWFLYWKTSAALWESKIREIPLDEVIFIPLNWGFHSDSPDSFDFGESLPERDLLRLSQTLTQQKRKFCWLLPLSPAPFLPNGGVSVSGARTLSVNHEGIQLSALEGDGTLNKIYSFFEPKVFQSFVRFVQSFGDFLAKNQIRSQVFGTEFYYMEGLETHAYLGDCSQAFDQGFSRYLKKNHPSPNSLTPQEERELKSKFTQEVRELFSGMAEASLAPYWQGIQKIHCLGGSPRDTIERTLKNQRPQLSYFRDLFHHFSRGEWISSALLSAEEKKGILTQVLSDHFGKNEIEKQYHFKTSSLSLGEEWESYGNVQIIGETKNSHWQKIGLLSYLDEEFRWMYQQQDEVSFTTDWIEENAHKIKFFSAAGMDRTRFSQMMKLFMMGQKILFDKSGLSAELERRLEIFYLENNLERQSVNFQTQIVLTTLGDGKFITFEGDKLKTASQAKFVWKNIFKWLNLIQPEVHMDQDVFGLWKIRATSGTDLNYLDVRRFSVYNPTSYKKSITIKTQKHFAFMKMSDHLHAKAQSNPQGVDIELLPGGRVSLDFGHYEER